MSQLKRLSDLTVIIRGAGDLATACACRLYRAGFKRILMLEIPHPMAIRRLVSFCEAIYEGNWTVEGISAKHAHNIHEVLYAWDDFIVPVIIDPSNTSKSFLQPDIIVDAILAKKNLGTSANDASLVIALGPGFTAPSDCHYVIETQRGHNLGKILDHGAAGADTGIPGEIAGHGATRVIRAPSDGVFKAHKSICDLVVEGDSLGVVSGVHAKTELSGVVRGLIRDQSEVIKGLKIADVDPRGHVEYCGTISDKGFAIAGSVLEAVLRRFNS